MIPLPFTNGFYMSQSLPVSAQQCVNLHTVIHQAPALSAEMLVGTPGIDQLLTTGSTALDINRGSWVMAGVPFVVNGESLYKIESDYTATLLGEVEGTARVSMADNGTQLLVVCGGRGYVHYAEGEQNYFSEIVDDSFTENGDPQHVLYIDGYFLCTTDSKKFIISPINDALGNWNSLDAGSAEADPDVITAPAKINNQLYIFGSKTIEGFANVAVGADFPFRRAGVFAEKGCPAPFSIVTVNSYIFFVGRSDRESPAIWQYDGSGQPLKVSTTAIDLLLQELTEEEVGEVFAWTYAQKGAYFVGFALPSTAIVYDLISERWHERKSRVVATDGQVTNERFRVNSIAAAYGKLLVGDSEDGRIGDMNINIYDEYDSEIVRRASTQPFQNNMQSIRIPMVELTIESGVGNSDVTEPVVRMQRSLNGKTWTTWRSRSMGKIGEYGLRQIWYKNGFASRFESFAFECSDRCKVAFLQLTADIHGGNK